MVLLDSAGIFTSPYNTSTAVCHKITLVHYYYYYYYYNSY